MKRAFARSSEKYAALRFPLLSFCAPFILWLFLGRFFAIPADATSFYRDPDWSYLLNGVGLLLGHSPGQFDHPGALVHWISAGSASVIHQLWHPGQALADSALLHPEHYLFWQGVIMSLLAATAFALTSRNLWSRHGLLSAALFNLLLAGSPTVVFHLHRLNPEGVLILLCVLFVSALSKMNSAATQPFPAAARMGLIIGAGLATKIVFAPLLLLLAALKRKQIAITLLCAAVVSLVILSPVLDKLFLTAGFYQNIFWHKGSYGRGGQGIIGVAEAWQNISTIFLRDCTFFLLSLLLGACRAFPGRLSEKEKKLLSLGLLMVPVALLMIAKHGIGDTNPASRYLLPVEIALAGIAAILAPSWLRGRRARAILPFLAFMLTSQGMSFTGELQAVRNGAGLHQTFFYNFTTARSLFPHCAWVEADYHFSRLNSLHAAGIYTARNFSQDLTRIYPGVFFLMATWPRPLDWHDRRWIPNSTFADKLESGGCLVLAGVALEDEKLALPGRLRITRLSGTYLLVK